jgi:predicted O-linked N-acetylglucosamine transferase (SPINDLY family)
LRLSRACEASSSTKASKDNLRREAGACGIAPERLVFAEPCPQVIHLARLRLADLVLDTLPFCSRVAGSPLHAISLA